MFFQSSPKRGHIGVEKKPPGSRLAAKESGGHLKKTSPGHGYNVEDGKTDMCQEERLILITGVHKGTLGDSKKK